MLEICDYDVGVFAQKPRIKASVITGEFAMYFPSQSDLHVEACQ